MISRFKVYCHSFVWYLIVAFTICSIPHFELVPLALSSLLGSEAYAAQASDVSSSPNVSRFTDVEKVCSAGSCPVREYVYDARDRVVTERQILDNGGVLETHYAYSGFSTTKTDPDGRVKTETRDYLGRIVGVVKPFEGKALRTSYSYNAAGDLLGMLDPTGHSAKEKKIGEIVKDPVLNNFL